MRRAAALIIALALGISLLILRGDPGRNVPLYEFQRPPQAFGLELIERPRTAADKIVNGAKLEAIRRVVYNSSYVSVSYPYGDVPSGQGACTDVLVRALRNAGYDLQKLIHEDMKRHFALYPNNWGHTRPDPNIDHRRALNHLAFMRRFAKDLPTNTDGDAAATWKPGDLVYWDLTGNGATHCGVISNDRNARGLPLVVHNIGPTARQDDCLNNWEIIGHFRYPRTA